MAHIAPSSTATTTSPGARSASRGRSTSVVAPDVTFTAFMIAESRWFNVSMELPAGVTTTLDDDVVRATAMVGAPPDEVFDFLRRPMNHAVISGDKSVRDNISGPELLGPGTKFTMSMKVCGVPYRVSSKVVEFEQDRLIAWRHVGGHRWRWVLEPLGAKATRVTETFDQSTAKLPFVLRVVGYPKRHLPNVTTSVANVAAHFAALSAA